LLLYFLELFFFPLFFDLLVLLKFMKKIQQ
jgi:hypothetical protein